MKSLGQILKDLHESSIGAALDIQDDVSLPEDRPDVVLQHGGRELGVGSAQSRHQLARPGELQPVPSGLARPGDQLADAVDWLVVVVLLLVVVVQFVHPAGPAGREILAVRLQALTLQHHL